MLSAVEMEYKVVPVAKASEKELVVYAADYCSWCSSVAVECEAGASSQDTKLFHIIQISSTLYKASFSFGVTDILCQQKKMQHIQMQRIVCITELCKTDPCKSKACTT